MSDKSLDLTESTGHYSSHPFLVCCRPSVIRASGTLSICFPLGVSHLLIFVVNSEVLGRWVRWLSITKAVVSEASAVVAREA